MSTSLPVAATHIELPELKLFKSGKVREVYDLDNRLFMVASDRISAFDCVLPTGIPDKGRVLNQFSAWWFAKTEHIIPNHMISTRMEDFPKEVQDKGEVLRGRSMLVRKTRALPVECVVRGYLIGSGWKDYCASGCVCGLPLRPGYQMADKLDEAIFTPAHKADTGHDENISFEAVAERLGTKLATQLRDVSMALYRFAADYALERGIIIADTKFEFGLDDDDQLILIDEALTPDSSRFWPADQYTPGMSPPSFDKQYVRDYLSGLDWDKTPPAPPLPQDVLERSREKYLEAFRLISGSNPE